MKRLGGLACYVSDKSLSNSQTKLQIMKRNLFTQIIKMENVPGCPWEKIVYMVINAFNSQDWEIVIEDFIPAVLLGVDPEKQNNIDKWDLKFLDLEVYKNVWLLQTKDLSKIDYIYMKTSI